MKKYESAVKRWKKAKWQKQKTRDRYKRNKTKLKDKRIIEIKTSKERKKGNKSMKNKEINE